MATTETQLMLSVGLIGKFRLGSRSFVFFFKAKSASQIRWTCRTITWYYCDPRMSPHWFIAPACSTWMALDGFLSASSNLVIGSDALRRPWKSSLNAFLSPDMLNVATCCFYFPSFRERCEWRHFVGVVLSICGRWTKGSPAQQVLPDTRWPWLSHFCVWSVLPYLVLHYYNGSTGADSTKQGKVSLSRH